jgi:DNA modification methylase
MSKLTKISDLTPDPQNANKGTERGRGMIEDSLRRFGAGRSILVDKHNCVIAGNKTLEAADDIGLAEAIIVETDGTKLVVVKRTDLDLEGDGDMARQLAYADNRTSEVGLEWDLDRLAEDVEAGLDLRGLFSELEIENLLAGRNGGSAPSSPEEARRTLAERFIVPPFSVLDARQGYWQERKRAWIALGIRGELGRGACLTWTGEAVTEPGLNHYRKQEKTLGAIPPNEREILSRSYKQGSTPPGAQDGGSGLLIDGYRRQSRKDNGLLGESEQARRHYRNSPGGSPRPAASLKNGHTVRGDGKGRELRFGEGGMAFDGGPMPAVVNIPQTGTSIFDPVLCEIAYRWFSPPGGKVLDPFAGGSVRGIVAALLGRQYTGIDLSEAQIAANREQWEEIEGDWPNPSWIIGDAREVNEIAAAEYDFVFSCPPYFDLEIYGDDAADLSNMADYGRFLLAYRQIIGDCVSMLKPDAFACFVVGDIRDRAGFYRNFVSDTISAFQDAGAGLYNDAVLITAVGSLPIRAGRVFVAGRKLGKTHQNVLIFYKGDPNKIEALPEALTDSDWEEALCRHNGQRSEVS